MQKTDVTSYKLMKKLGLSKQATFPCLVSVKWLQTVLSAHSLLLLCLLSWNMTVSKCLCFHSALSPPACYSIPHRTGFHHFHAICSRPHSQSNFIIFNARYYASIARCILWPYGLSISLRLSQVEFYLIKTA